MKLNTAGVLAASITALLAALTAPGASAQIKVGVTLSSTGGGAPLGIVERNTVALFPRNVANQTVEYIVLDDATDPVAASKNTRKFIDEHKVDIIIGSSTTPNSLAMLPILEEASTPMLSMGSGASIVSPLDSKRRWAFKTSQNDALMIDAVLESMQKRNVKRLGYIGLGDSSGEGYLAAIQQLAPKYGLEVAGVERYARDDQSVTSQALRLIAQKPDAIFVGSFSTAAALPQIALIERGYKGPIYHTHGVAGNDFLRVAGASAEGIYLPVGPLLVADQLPESNPVRKVAEGAFKAYESKYGAGSGNSYIALAQDTFILFENAVPAALTQAKPGTREFREALRNALEQTKEVVGTQGVYNMTPTDHSGLDKRARVIVQVKSGRWTLAE